MNAEVEKADNGQPEPAAGPFVVLHNSSGDVIFTSTIPEPSEYSSKRSLQWAMVWPQVLRAAFDAGIDSKDIALFHRPLHGIDFRNLDLSGITLVGCSFRDSDLRGATLDNANLEDCDFGLARMQGASVIGAKLRGSSLHGVEANTVEGLIIMGHLNGYFVWAYPADDKELRVRAGCRDFALQRARAHWKDQDDRDEIYRSLDLIEFLAKRRGWNVEAPTTDDDDL